MKFEIFLELYEYSESIRMNAYLAGRPLATLI